MELFRLLGTIAIDTTDMEKAFDKARKGGEETERNFSGSFAKIGSTIGAVGKLAVAGVAAAGTAIGGFVTKSVQAYANYEQLVGGVDTLFKESSQLVQQYADQAYKTAGLSANAYMETVTSFSGSLLQSLGNDTEKAAEYGNLAIMDMSDNANKMGTDMGMIQNAYQGFAKQNYTMLDNLKLGYGGTKSEMERLIDDANKLKVAQGETADLTIDSYADVIEAIHLVQTEMGITGTTAKEAEGTITGSIAMTKGAWENLMTGLARDNADIPKLVSEVVSSGTQVIKNIIPIAKQVLQNIPAAISEISPEAGAAFQTIIDICIGAFDILKGAIEPTFALITNIFNFLTQNTGVLIAIASAIGIITTAIGLYNAVAAIKAAMAAAEVTTVWGLVAAYAAQAVAMAAALAPYLLIAAAIAAVIAIIVVCVKHWDQIKEAAVNAWQWICDAWGKAADWFNTNVIQPIVTFFQGLWDGIVNIWNGICNAVQVAIMLIAEIITTYVEIITLPWRFLWENCKEYVFAAWEWIKNAVNNAISFVRNIITTAWNFISSVTSSVWNAIVGFLSPIISAIRNAISTGFNAAKTVVSNIWNSVKTVTSNVWNGIKTVVSNVVNGVKTAISNGLNSAKSTVSNILSGIKNKFQSIFDSAKNIVKNAIDKIKSYFNFSWSLPKIKLPHFSISGKFSLDPPSVPKFSISWYKKAMDNAMLLNSPTIFGYSGKSGKFLGGGEAGSEVVAGSETLMNMIQGAVAEQNGAMTDRLDSLIDMIARYLPEIAINSERQFVFDTGATAGALAPAMDRELGKLSNRKDRGR